MARLNKTQQDILSNFGFVVSEPPERTATRSSKYDDMWEAAKKFLESSPGVTIKVRVYANPSAAYSDAKKINNGEHRHFKDGTVWTAVASKTEDEFDEDGNPLYGVWLTYTPVEEE